MWQASVRCGGGGVNVTRGTSAEWVEGALWFGSWCCPAANFHTTPMNDKFSSLLRHVATWIGGLTALVMMLPFMLPEDAGEVAKHVDAIAVGVVGLFGVILTRALPWIWDLIAKVARERFSPGDGGGGPVAGFMIMAAAVSLGSLLPSCSAGDYDLKGAVIYRFGDSGAKAGLTFSPGESPKGFVRHALTDPETGEVTGWVDIEAGRKVEAAK